MFEFIKNLTINPTKEILKIYFFWQEVIQNMKYEEFKDRLKNIEKTIVYKSNFNHFALTLNEAKSLFDKFEEITIKDVLNSETYPLFLLKRLQRLTSYQKDDLKNIPKSSKLVWTKVFDIDMHFVLDKNKIIYPQNYGVNSPLRYGYMILNYEGLKGLYDIDNEKLVLDTKYKHLEKRGNIIEVSEDLKIFTILDIQTNKTLQTNTTSIIENLPFEIKQKIDLSKTTLQELMSIFPTPQNKEDLETMGLWGKKVIVSELPNDWDEMIEDYEGSIGWESDGIIGREVFDFNTEIPIVFTKKDGGIVSLGVSFDKVILLEREHLKDIEVIENFKETPLPDWFLIKYKNFDKVEKNKTALIQYALSQLSTLTKEEFEELMREKDNVLSLMIFLTLLSDKDINYFFEYIQGLEIEKLENVLKNDLEIMKQKEVSDEMISRVILEIPLIVNGAKYSYTKKQELQKHLQNYYYSYEDDLVIFEASLMYAIYQNTLDNLPDSFEEILSEFSKIYNKNKHYEIGLHLIKKFGLLANSLYVIQKGLNDKTDGLSWFLETFKNELENIDDKDIDTIINKDVLIIYIMNIYASIITEDSISYISSLLYATKELFKYYPINDESCIYILGELCKSIPKKEINEEIANEFIEFFEELPKLYDNLNYIKLTQLKENINYFLVNYDPLANEVFEKDNVKNKKIVLDFLVDMEDIK